MFFDYALPENLIAQYPAATRDQSRLLVIHRERGTFEHRQFADLPEYLSPGDVVVWNDSHVLPARLLGHRAQTGGKWEGLYVQTMPDGSWLMLTQTRGYAQPGERFNAGDGFELELIERTPEKQWLMRPNLPGTALELLTRFGTMPLPPYIRKGRGDASDTTRYQTVYAAASGSVAAPTAGLHFTPELIQTLHQKEIATAAVTLHVGLGTFAPMQTDDPTQHPIHTEWCSVSQETADTVTKCKDLGRRVVAVGTTTTRTLETAAADGTLRPYLGETSACFYPPYRFKVVDALITNFHLPRTTLLLLVQALCGSESLRAAYEEAIRREYRFYSYGDAMLIV